MKASELASLLTKRICLTLTNGACDAVYPEAPITPTQMDTLRAKLRLEFEIAAQEINETAPLVEVLNAHVRRSYPKVTA